MGFDSRYLIVVCAFLIQGVMIGSMFAYGVFFKVLETDLGWSRTTLSAAFSASFLIMGVMGIVSGRLSDRFGPRAVLSVAGAVFGLGYALMYFMSSPWQMFVLYGLLIGTGLSAHDVVTLSTVARWFDKRRGMMTGIVKIGTACGQMAIPLLAAVLITHFGWRSALAILGCGAAVLLVLAAQGMRRDPPAYRERSSPATASSAPATGIEAGLTLREALRTRQFWTLCGVQVAFFASLVTIPVHLPVHGMDLGLSPTRAATLLTAIGLCSVIGRVLVGASADRIGGRRAMMICLLGLMLSLLILLAVHSPMWLFAFAAIYGAAHGGLFTVVAPIIAEYFGTVAHGAIFGMVLFFGTLGGAFGPLLAGMAFDRSGSYQVVFFGLALLACLGVALLVTLKPLAGPPPRIE